MNSLMTVEIVRGYLDPANGTAYLNAEDVARGFGFTPVSYTHLTLPTKA